MTREEFIKKIDLEIEERNKLYNPTNLSLFNKYFKELYPDLELTSLFNVGILFCCGCIVYSNNACIFSDDILLKYIQYVNEKITYNQLKLEGEFKDAIAGIVENGKYIEDSNSFSKEAKDLINSANKALSDFKNLLNSWPDDFQKVISLLKLSNSLKQSLVANICRAYGYKNLEEFKKVYNSIKKELGGFYESTNLTSLTTRAKDLLHKIYADFDYYKKSQIKYRSEIKQLERLKERVYSSKEEIINVEDWIINIPVSMKEPTLRFIADHNNIYYKKLGAEYSYSLENSFELHVQLFQSIGIDFNSLDDDIKNSILKSSVADVKKIIEFIKYFNIDISYFSIITIEKINRINDLLSENIITKNFVASHPEILNDSIFVTFLNNINLLMSNRINVKNISERSSLIYFGDSNLIVQNIDLLDKYGIKLNRNLTNYVFLLNPLLEKLIIGLIDYKIDINKDLSVLNADMNILKRIRICELMGIQCIQDGLLIEQMYNQETFFVKEEELDNFINDLGNYISFNG